MTTSTTSTTNTLGQVVSESTTITSPLNTTTVSTTNMGFSNNQVVATAANAAIAINPLTQPSGVAYNNLSPTLIYQPKAHNYLPGSSVNEILVDTNFVDNLNSNNYSTIDLDINDELVSLEINTDIVLKKVIQGSLQSNNFVFPENVYTGMSFQTSTTAFMIDYAGNVYSAPILASGILGNWSNTNNSIPSFSFRGYQNNPIIVGNYVYVYNTGSFTIYSAEILSNGGMGLWNSQTVEISATPPGACFFISGNVLFAASNVSSTIYTFPINADGTLGTMTTSTVSLPFTPTGGMTSVTVDGNIYLLGTGSAVSYIVNINSTTNEITSITSAGLLPDAIAYGQAIVLNGVIYYIGGAISTEDTSYTDPSTNNIYQGTISGTTITWAVSSLSIPTPVNSFGVIVTNNYIFMIGGYTSSVGETNMIQQLSYLGSNLINFTQTPQLSNNIANAGSFFYNNYAYVLGGYNGTAPTDSVYYLYINSENGIGSPVPITNLPVAIYDFSLVVLGTTVYLIGGNLGSKVNSDIIYSATIGTNGNITGWTNTGNNLPVALAGSACCYTSTAVYLIGGYTYSSTTQTAEASVYMIPIESTGTLGAPTLLSVALPATQYYCSAIILNSILYVASGNNTSTNIYLSLINSDNTINNFGNFANPLPSNGGAGLLMTYGNFIYFIGGTSGQIYQCSVEANSVSPWVYINTLLPTEYRNMCGIIGDNYLYTLGGINQGTYTNRIYSFSISDNNYYTLLPKTPLAALPNNIYLLGNLTAQGLIGELTVESELATLAVNSRSISTAIVTYEFEPVFASDPTTGGNAYFQLNNLNEGDAIITISGVIEGTIIPAPSTTSTTA